MVILIVVLLIVIVLEIVATVSSHQMKKSYDAYVNCLKNQNVILKELLRKTGGEK